MTTRQQFLDRLRARLADGVPHNPLRPLGGPTDEPIDYALDPSDPIARFAESAGAAGAELVGEPGETLETLLGRVCDSVDPQRAVVSADPECDGAAQILAALGVEVLAAEFPEVVAQADLGVTGALGGIALTGSLIVDSRRAQSRLASLLPEVHLALLPAEAIVATPGDLWRHLPEELPSNLVTITGPSRSADIELQLTIGVHGPRRVLIALR